VATSELAAVTSAKGKNEPMVRNLSCSRRRPGKPGPQNSELRLAKKALSGCARRKLKKAKAKSSEAGTGGIQQPVTASLTKQLETPTENPKRPRSEGSASSKTIRPPKRPRDWKGPGNYKEALTNIRVAIFKHTFPEDKVTENDQD
jgi:hypothetical protein